MEELEVLGREVAGMAEDFRSKIFIVEVLDKGPDKILEWISQVGATMQ